MINKIGIICVSDTELNPFLKQIKVTKTINKTMLKFYQSNFLQFELILVYSGVCKVNVVITIQKLINLFNVDMSEQLRELMNLYNSLTQLFLKKLSIMMLAIIY